MDRGEKLNRKRPTESKAGAAINANGKSLKAGVIGIALIVAIVMIAGIILFGGRSYKDTVEQYVNAQFGPNADAKAIFELVPKEVLDNLINDILKAIDDDADDSYDKCLDWIFDTTNEECRRTSYLVSTSLGTDDWKLSCEIVDVEDVTGDALDDIKESYERFGVEVSSAKTVGMILTAKAGNSQTTITVSSGEKVTNVTVIKVGRSWYIDLLWKYVDLLWMAY